MPVTPAADVTAKRVVLVTIDTLRADRVGAYGLTSARTPVMDGLARAGARFDRAYATAPITLTSHASLLTGRYPAGHGARHNGMAMRDTVPTMATMLKAAGFATGAFVSAFPLDRRFGLTRGFDDYDDQLGRDAGGKPLNERSGAQTVTRAIAWLDAHRQDRFFLWLHLFEPHAPYGVPPGVGSRPASARETSGELRRGLAEAEVPGREGGESGVDGRESAGGRLSGGQTSVLARYDEEVATADAMTGRMLTALGDAASSTLVIVASDHGEAFGEHGEIGHSIFVYDATLRVPLIIHGPRVPSGRSIDAAVSLVDVAPTIADLLGLPRIDADGVSLTPLLNGQAIGDRAIYAESFAPLFDFGWSPLRAVRDRGWKLIVAPKPELFDLSSDTGESRNIVDTDPPRVTRMRARVDALGGPDPTTTPVADVDARRRLESLGYVSGRATESPSTRPDPKDRIQIASRLASVMAGEVQGAALITTLEAVLNDDPANPQAHLRLGYAYIEAKRCDRAEPHFRTALDARLPSADAGLGLAGCLVGAGNLAGARAALQAADVLEPGNPVVQANLGLIALQQADAATAVTHLTAALAVDPTLLEARFALARALARLGRRADAAREARTLLDQLPPNAPQRSEVERLLDAVR